MFHVSMLRKHELDPYQVLPPPTIEIMQINKNLSYEERPERIIDRKITRLTNKDIVSIKVV